MAYSSRSAVNFLAAQWRLHHKKEKANKDREDCRPQKYARTNPREGGEEKEKSEEALIYEKIVSDENLHNKIHEKMEKRVFDLECSLRVLEDNLKEYIKGAEQNKTIDEPPGNIMQLLRVMKDKIMDLDKCCENLLNADRQEAVAKRIDERLKRWMARWMVEDDVAEALKWAKKRMEEDYCSNRPWNDESDGEEGQCWREQARPSG